MTVFDEIDKAIRSAEPSKSDAGHTEREWEIFRAGEQHGFLRSLNIVKGIGSPTPREMVAHMQTDFQGPVFINPRLGIYDNGQTTISFCGGEGSRYYIGEQPANVKWCSDCAAVYEEKTGRKWPKPEQVEDQNG